jgi:hypothetical protein
MWQYSNGNPNYYHLCKYWDNPNSASSDYWYNFPGAQNGIAFVGIACYEPAMTNVREYIQGELTTTLTAGNAFEFSVYVRLDTISSWKLCSLHVAFSSARQYSPTLSPFSFTNALSIDVSAATTNTWVKCTVTFTASGGERYFILGNFKSDALSCFSFYTNSPYSDASYYDLDAVSLINSATNFIDENSKMDTFTIFPNPTNGVVNILGGEEKKIIKLYDNVGRMILETGMSNERILDLSKFDSGVYTISILSNKKLYRSKVIIAK